MLIEGADLCLFFSHKINRISRDLIHLYVVLEIKIKASLFAIPTSNWIELLMVFILELLYVLFLSYFFVKKISLSRRDEYVVDGSMDQ